MVAQKKKQIIFDWNLMVSIKVVKSEFAGIAVDISDIDGLLFLHHLKKSRKKVFQRLQKE